MGMRLKDEGIDMSVEEAMKTLERLKAVHIVVKKDDGIQVLRKLTDLDSETRTLVEVFKMAGNEKFPEVDTEKFK
jgi:hypothetical protein